MHGDCHARLEPKVNKMFIILLFTIVTINIHTRHSGAVPVLPLHDQNKKRECYAERMNCISTDIAIKAAEEADEAQRAQQSAGYQAAHQVREELAEKAIEAAKAAQIALAGKIALVEELTRETEAVKVVLQEELNSKLQLEQSINQEMKALSDGKNLLNILSAGLHLAEKTAADADTSLKAVEENLRQKNILLQQALRAVETFTREEAMARNDLETTKCAARRAVQSAAEAKSNAMRNRREVEQKLNE